MTTFTCASPECSNATLMAIPIESTLTNRRYQCNHCKRTYNVPTTLGLMSQIAPLATATAIVASFVLGHPELFDSGSDFIDG